MNKHYFLYPVLLTLLTWACNSPEKSEEIPGLLETSIEIGIDTSEQERYQFIPPSPVQIARIFKKAGLNYRADLPYAPNNYNSAASHVKLSLVFGLYSADLAYSVMNEKYDEASLILQTIRDIAGKIGLETVFDRKDLTKRFERNIGNLDSITNILIYVQEHTDEYIAENGKDELAVIYYTGAWIEGMYLGAKTVMESSKEKLGQLLTEQINIAEMLVKGLDQIENRDELLTEIKTNIETIIIEFNGLESIKKMGDTKENFDIQLSSEEIKRISGKIVELRESIVE